MFDVGFLISASRKMEELIMQKLNLKLEIFRSKGRTKILSLEKYEVNFSTSKYHRSLIEVSEV